MQNNDNDLFLDLKTTKEYERLSIENQLKIKQNQIESIFNQKALPIVPNPTPKGYRHKVVLSATNIKEGNRFKIRLGLYQEGSRNVVPGIKHFLHDKEINDLFVTIEKLLLKYKLRAYHERSGEGIIKHVMVRKSFDNGTFLVTFVTHLNLFPKNKDLIRELVSAHPKVITVIQNIHKKNTSIVLLEEEKNLYGRGYIIDKIGDLSFQISSRAFYQINPEQMFNLYDKAISLVDLKPTDIVIDAYSGIGTIGLLIANKVKHVYGLEINDSAIKDAIKNKQINNIENATFIQGDVERTIDGFQEEVDLLILDPTRDGASLKFIQSVRQMKPKQILYLSCDPRTQNRDIIQLLDLYKIAAIQPIDMFSYTKHVENIVLLSLKTA